MAWHTFTTDSIRIWFDTRIYRMYGQLLKTANEETIKSIKISGTGDFDAMIEMDEFRRPDTTSKVVFNGLTPILKFLAEQEAFAPARPFGFQGGNQSFTDHTIQRNLTTELYVDTKPSAYEKVVQSVVATSITKGTKKQKNTPVEGTLEQQARTVRRLLKGYYVQGTKTVKDTRLERITAIWGVSEAFRNPSMIGHFLIVLYLIKKGLLTWEEAIDPKHESHFIASEKEASAKLQALRKATLANIKHKHEIPLDLRTFARPLDTNIAKFLVHAAANAHKSVNNLRDNGLQIKHPTVQKHETVIVCATDRDKADGFIDTIFEQKILNHFK